jgi:hypothetical protein
MLETSNLQTMRLINACFWRKIKAVLQKNRGLLENILHFFSRFPGFLGFFPLQSVASQGQAAIKTLQKKSCLKTYRRFFVRSGLCHNRPMNGRIVHWEMGREKPTAGRRDHVAHPAAAASSGPVPVRPPSDGRRDAAPTRRRGRLRYGPFTQTKPVASRRSK